MDECNKCKYLAICCYDTWCNFGSGHCNHEPTCELDPDISGHCLHWEVE